MPNNVYVFGNGGHARVVADMVGRPTTFVTKDGIQSLSEREFFCEHANGADVYVAIGDNSIRRRVFAELKRHGIVPATLVSRACYVSKQAQIGAGSVICHGAVVGPSATVAEGCIVNTLSSVDHDCFLGEFSQVTAGVTLGGTVTLGSECFLGIKAGVIPNVTLGDRVKVAAGSLVTKSFLTSALVGGVPARIIRMIDEQ